MPVGLASATLGYSFGGLARRTESCWGACPHGQGLWLRTPKGFVTKQPHLPTIATRVLSGGGPRDRDPVAESSLSAQLQDLACLPAPDSGWILAVASAAAAAAVLLLQ